MNVILALLDLITAALNGRKTDEEVARGLIDTAFESGIAPSILLAHLSEKGRQNAELAADVAEFVKLNATKLRP